MSRPMRRFSVICLVLTLTGCPASKPKSIEPTSGGTELIKPSPAIDGRPQSQQTPPFVPPAALLRPISLPHVASGQSCPITTKHDITIDGQPYRGVLGRGPAYLLLEVSRDRNGVSHYGSSLRPVSGWLLIAGTWWVAPRETHPLLVRARRLDGAGSILLGGWGPSLGKEIEINDGSNTSTLSPGRYLTQKDVPNVTTTGWTNYPPDYIGIHRPGCYGFQVDGLTFSYSIIVKLVP